jgi:hypothetical protein
MVSRIVTVSMVCLVSSGRFHEHPREVTAVFTCHRPENTGTAPGESHTIPVNLRPLTSNLISEMDKRPLPVGTLNS